VRWAQYNVSRCVSGVTVSAVIASRGSKDSGVVFLSYRYPSWGFAGWPLELKRQSLQAFLLGIAPAVADATLTLSLPRSLRGLVDEAD